MPNKLKLQPMDALQTKTEIKEPAVPVKKQVTGAEALTVKVRETLDAAA